MTVIIIINANVGLQFKLWKKWPGGHRLQILRFSVNFLHVQGVDNYRPLSQKNILFPSNHKEKLAGIHQVLRRFKITIPHTTKF